MMIAAKIIVGMRIQTVLTRGFMSLTMMATALMTMRDSDVTARVKAT